MNELDAVEINKIVIRRIAAKIILDPCRSAMKSTNKAKELFRWFYDPEQRRSFCGVCMVLRRDPQITVDKITRKLESKFGRDIIRKIINEVIEELQIPIVK